MSVSHNNIPARQDWTRAVPAAERRARPSYLRLGRFQRRRGAVVVLLLFECRRPRGCGERRGVPLLERAVVARDVRRGPHFAPGFFVGFGARRRAQQAEAVAGQGVLVIWRRRQRSAHRGTRRLRGAPSSSARAPVPSFGHDGRGGHLPWPDCWLHRGGGPAAQRTQAPRPAAPRPLPRLRRMRRRRFLR